MYGDTALDRHHVCPVTSAQEDIHSLPNGLTLNAIFAGEGITPGVAQRSQAGTIGLHSGDNLADLRFSLGKTRVHTVLFDTVSADGSLLPLGKLGVSVDALERDALAYHLTQARNINGEFPAGYVPLSNYPVQRYVRPDLKTGKIPAEPLRWRMARRELYIGTDLEIVLKLSPAN